MLQNSISSMLCYAHSFDVVCVLLLLLKERNGENRILVFVLPILRSSHVKTRGQTIFAIDIVEIRSLQLFKRFFVLCALLRTIQNCVLLLLLLFFFVLQSTVTLMEIAQTLIFTLFFF